jgi:hypothetical protein
MSFRTAARFSSVEKQDGKKAEMLWRAHLQGCVDFVSVFIWIVLWSVLTVWKQCRNTTGLRWKAGGAAAWPWVLQGRCGAVVWEREWGSKFVRIHLVEKLRVKRLKKKWSKKSYTNKEKPLWNAVLFTSTTTEKDWC